MTATQTAETVARIGQSDWNLVSIVKGSGTCDHCGRGLKNLYEIRSAQAGSKMTVGRGCVKKITGWTLAIAEAQRLIRYAERLIVRAANWSRFTAENAELAARIEADIFAYENDGKHHEVGGAAHEIRFNISDGRVCAGTEREYAERCLAHMNTR